MELQKVLNDFYTFQGQCERIKKFPLPRQYGSMSFVFIAIFIFLLTDSRSLQPDGDFNGDFEQEANTIFQNEFSTFDAGFNFGATYEFPFKVFVQARYYLGVLDINDTDSSNEKLRNNVLQFAVGYSF